MDLKRKAANTIREMTIFVRKELGLPLFSVKSRLSMSPRRTRSWGGARRVWMQEPVGYVSIQLRRYDPAVWGTSRLEYKEYAAINHHKTIGGFKANDPYLCTAAVIAHEIAHAVEHYCIMKGADQPVNHPLAGNFVRGSEFKGHGRTWQAIYHILREKFINPNVSAVEPFEPLIKFDLPRPVPTIPAMVNKPTFSLPGASGSNIDRVCAMMRNRPGAGNEWYLNEIMRMLPTITRSNAKIYLAKGRARTGV
jgi:hypothetical protein